MRHSPLLRGAGLAVLAITIGATSLAAQQPARILITDLPLVEQTRIRAEMEAAATEAGELEAEARAADRAGDYRKAARLYEESGRLRTAGDVLGIEAYELAGRAHYFSERPGRASTAWEEAGNRGLILGDVYGAALNYMRAAVAAQEKGDRVRATELGWKAYHLTESPQLTSSQRTELRGHLRVEGTG